MRKTINSPAFRALYRAQKGQCFYCSKRMLSIDGKSEDLTLDHFVPLSRGGDNHISNYVLSCRQCNLDKSDKWPSAKQRSKKFMIFKYIKHNKPNIFKINFVEKKSYFDIKRLCTGNQILNLETENRESK